MRQEKYMSRKVSGERALLGGMRNYKTAWAGNCRETVPGECGTIEQHETETAERGGSRGMRNYRTAWARDRRERRFPGNAEL